MCLFLRGNGKAKKKNPYQESLQKGCYESFIFGHVKMSFRNKKSFPGQ